MNVSWNFAGRYYSIDPWLIASNFTDYLIDPFDLVQLKSSASLPNITSSATLYVGQQTATTTTVTATTNITVAPTPTCLGQVVHPMSNWLTCNDFCDQ